MYSGGIYSKENVSRLCFLYYQHMDDFNNNPYRRSFHAGAEHHGVPFQDDLFLQQDYQAYSRANYGRGTASGAPPKRKRAWNIVFIAAAAVLLVCLAVLGIIVHGYWSGTKTYDEISQAASVSKEPDALQDMQMNWDVLREQNPDVVGWIYMPGTSIDYPIVQGETDEEYLKKNFAGEEGIIVSKGAIFLSVVNDADFSDKNNFIYGHNMNDDTMFAHVLQMADQDVFDEARTFFILTPDCNYRCKTLALDIVEATETELIQTAFLDDNAFASYIDDRVSDSVVDGGDAIDSASISKLFTLVTCGDDYASTRAILTGGVVEQATPSDAS